MSDIHVPNSPAVNLATAACTTGSDAQRLAFAAVSMPFWRPDTDILENKLEFACSPGFVGITGGNATWGEIMVGNPA